MKVKHFNFENHFRFDNPEVNRKVYVNLMEDITKSFQNGTTTKYIIKCSDYDTYDHFCITIPLVLSLRLMDDNISYKMITNKNTLEATIN